MKCETGLTLAFVLFAALLAWLGSGVSLLDDDWGHVRLGAAGFPRILMESWVGETGAGGYYRPVSTASLYLDFLFSGYGPALYHVTNVVLHSLCGVLVFLFTRLLLPGAPPGTAWAAMLLFHALPIHTDTVFWIVGRTDSLCALFYLGACMLFLAYLEQPSHARLAGFGACFLLALYAKEMALSLPGALVVLAVYGRRLRTGAALRALVAAALLLGVYLLTRQAVLGGLFVGVQDRNLSLTVWSRQVLRAGAMIGMTDFRPFGGLLLLATAGVWALAGRPREVLRDVGCLAGVTLVSLVPALGHIRRWYLYLPSAFVCMAVARVWMGCIPRGRAWRWVRTGLLGAVLAYYGAVMVREGLFWREASALSESFLREVAPHLRREGTVYMVNTPAAYTPPGSLGGKPLFAFGLPAALAIRTGGNAAPPVVVNHFWLLDRADFHTRIERVERGRFRLFAERGGYFSFHGPGDGAVYARDGRTAREGTLERPWGEVRVHSREGIEVRVNLQGGDRVVAYNGGSVKEIER